MLLLVAPLARLPYVPAFFVWIGASLCLSEVALYAILPESLTIVLALLPWPVVNNVFVGQMAFLTAVLRGLIAGPCQPESQIYRECASVFSTYKPQLVLFYILVILSLRGNGG